MRRDLSPSDCAIILVADDHQVVRHGLVDILQTELGAKKVLEAENFAEALDLADTPGLCLAIVDLDMPGVPGPRAFTAIRRKSSDAKVVVLSGSGRREDIIASLAAGVHGYILKTASTDDLVDYLKRVLSGEIYAPPELARIDHQTEALPTVGIRTSADLLTRFTSRQIEILEGIEQGLTNKEIAQKSELSVRTVKMHVTAILQIFGVRNRTQAAALARQLSQDVTLDY